MCVCVCVFVCVLPIQGRCKSEIHGATYGHSIVVLIAMNVTLEITVCHDSPVCLHIYILQEDKSRNDFLFVLPYIYSRITTAIIVSYIFQGSERLTKQ